MSNVTRKLAGEVGRLLLAYVLIFSQGAWAAQDAKPADTGKTAQKTAVAQAKEKPSAAGAAKTEAEEVQAEASENATVAEKSSGDGKHEGIKVHGHWTIEVRNPDGTVVSHREFENSLAQTPVLASILSRQNSVGFWTIDLIPGTVCNIANGAPCSIEEPGQSQAQFPSTSANLSVTVSGNILVFTGSLVAAGGGTITLVQTGGYGCPPAVAPSAPCVFGSSNFGFGADGSFIFTQTSPNPGISVSAGQTVAVTVNVSFS